MRRSLIIRYVSLVCLFLCCMTEGRAQFDARFSQYWSVKGYYNPAWAGQTDQMNLYGSYGMQLAGFTHAPKVMCLGADLPFSLFNKNHGAGVGFFSEGIGLFRNQRFWGQYAYQMKIRKGKLGIGLQAGLLTVSFDPSGIHLGDETNDEAFPATAERGTAVDVGAGISYSHPKFYAAFSAQHLTAPTLSLGEKSELQIHPVVYLTGGYNIQTPNPLISIQPSFQLQTDFTAARLDVTGRLFYSYRGKVFNGGLTYSPATSFTFSLGMTVRKMTVGYAYEWFTSKIGMAGGSHELVVGYALDLNVFKKNRNLHKSVRIL